VKILRKLSGIKEVPKKKEKEKKGLKGAEKHAGREAVHANAKAAVDKAAKVKVQAEAKAPAGKAKK
jgi:hypothetical protein